MFYLQRVKTKDENQAVMIYYSSLSHERTCVEIKTDQSTVSLKTAKRSAVRVYDRDGKLKWFNSEWLSFSHDFDRKLRS
jgi:A-macroglobulin receptor binding domain